MDKLDESDFPQVDFSRITFEEFMVFQKASEEVFSNGPIERGQAAQAAAKIVRATNTSRFLQIFNALALHTVIKTPDDSWWEGLDAFSVLAARLLTEGIGAMLKPGQKIDHITFGHFGMVRERELRGPGGAGLPFPDVRSEDPVFSRLWARAVQTPTPNSWYQTVRNLAELWDGSIVPFRYFSDSAAMVCLNAMVPVMGGSRVEMDSYRKDIRGDRKGLGLKPPSPDRTVVKWFPREANVLRFDAEKGKRVGLRVDGFDGAEFLGLKYKVT